MITRELEDEFRKLGGHAIKHLLCIHPDDELIQDTCKSYLGDDYQRSEPVSLKRFVMCTDVAIDALVELEDICKEMKLENTSKQVKEVIGDLVCAKHEIEKYT